MEISKLKIAGILVLGLLIGSCSDDNDGNNEIIPQGDYENGILISNEGPFGNGSGTVTFIGEDLLEEQQIFNKINGSDIGNILQSIGFYNEFAFLIANASNRISVVNRYTFEELGFIDEGLNNPRYFTQLNGKGYVTNWGDPNNNDDDFIAIIDLVKLIVVNTIPVDFGPEEIIVKNNQIYVAHQGGYGQNNLISIIDGASNDVVKKLIVGDVPNSILAVNNDIWVLSEGIPSWTGNETKGVLTKINSNTNEIENTFDFETTQHPNYLTIDNGELYYNLDGNVYKMSLSASQLPDSEIISGLYCYNMVAKDGVLYVTDAVDFASNGKLHLYDLTSTSLTNTFTTGIIPGGIYFN